MAERDGDRVRPAVWARLVADLLRGAADDEVVSLMRWGPDDLPYAILRNGCTRDGARGGAVSDAGNDGSWLLRASRHLRSHTNPPVGER